jgi:hypothetical protein
MFFMHDVLSIVVNPSGNTCCEPRLTIIIAIKANNSVLTSQFIHKTD